MSDQPKPPAKKRKSQPDHSVWVKSQWVEAAGHGHGIYVVPIVVGIIAVIVLNLAALMWLR
jgi:hypothetical protein